MGHRVAIYAAPSYLCSVLLVKAISVIMAYRCSRRNGQFFHPRREHAIPETGDVSGADQTESAYRAAFGMLIALSFAVTLPVGLFSVLYFSLAEAHPAK